MPRFTPLAETSVVSSIQSFPSTAAATVRAGSPRFDRLDALRGFALIWMASFHFSFDLSMYQVTRADFYDDPFWLIQRTCILSLFLLCAGAGQAVAVHQGQTWGRFWRRWAQVSGCALLVSAGSYMMFHDRFISFGVLHGMAVMLIVARRASRFGVWLLVIGIVALLLPTFVQHPFFDTRLTNWVGLITHKPLTEDYVPVLPWIGVMFFGLVGAQWLLAHRPAVLQGAVPAVLRPLALLGRWSLTFYMVHQPILIGALLAVLAFAR